MLILVVLYTGWERGYSHSISQSHGGRPTKHKGGWVPWMQGDGFASELGGITEVATWLCALLLVGL